ncbi:flavodoxin I [Paenibacillus phyllosphaerae]|uniref:Flavodoxin n=1 Tax=Paenibacillus phyllosphaerae TaxID=274593 RepID=A0A7W5AXP3_9BACL|nr:flavodoxin [Paenibacillus phyllosphaerae]MBB3110690.1 flavodoxin I [Paenibacillus phyllosphaerae]
MANIIIVFASMTGNTEEMADAIAAGVREAGIEPKVVDVLDAKAADLADYDGILLGAYTWGDGELPDEFLDYYAEMDALDLSGRKSAVFGSADSGYTQYGVAVDILLAKLAERGSENVLEGMKIELNPSEKEKEELRTFGRTFVSHLLQTV